MMEFTKEISFDEKLTADKVAKINYHGKLINTNSDSISIIYGFGQNWDYTEEKRMKKVDDGYEVEVPIKAYDTFNFCFKDGYNNWDNNSQFNYISPINKEDGNHSSGSGSGSDKKEDEIDEESVGVESVISAEDEDADVKVELAEIEAEISRIFDELFSVEEDAETEPNTIEDAFNQLFTEAGYDETYQSYRESIEEEQNAKNTVEQVLEGPGVNDQKIQLAGPKPEEDSNSEEDGESDIETIFDMLFKEAGYAETYKSYRESVEIQQAVANAFNQLFAEAGYDETYDSYRASVENKQAVATTFNQLFAEAGYDETYDSYRASVENEQAVATTFNQLFAEAGYDETYNSYRASVENEQAVATTFNQLFAEAGYDETYDSYKASTSEGTPVIQPEDEEETLNEEKDVYDIGAIFDELFKEAGYAETYQSYRKSIEIEQAVADAFNQLFAEAGYDMNYDSYRAEVSLAQQNPEPESDEFKEASLDDLVDEILKPLSDEYAVPDEVADVNEVSTVDDFDGIDVKNIELYDMDNIEIDDSTKDELQKLIEEIDSQIAMFEEKDEEGQKEDASVEEGIANIEETIQIPELKSLDINDDEESEDSVAKASTQDSDVNIDELFDYLKKYDDDEEENVVEEDQEDKEVEEKIALFDESEDNQEQPIEEEKEESQLSDNIQLAENDEQSIFDKVKEQKQDQVEEGKELTVSSRKLRNFYRITKKIKLAFIKVFYGIPKMLGKSNSTDNDE